tara:strand:- start:472 stop:2472 length:2001 start_codon:yes stop_codon:yes gene_type:complete
MSSENTEFIRTAISRELIFTLGFSVIASFISDFLQPLANITFYVLILSAVLSALLLLLYLIKKDIRKRFSKFLMASITLMVLSGFLYSVQDESNSEKGVLAANFPALGNLQKDLGMLEKDIAEIKESTLRTEQLVESIAEDSKENIKQTKELTKTIKDSNEVIANKLDEINDSFQEISKLGGIIADPKRPEEFYSNARVYEDRGDYLNARRMYNQYFTFKLDYVDPHLRYQTFLKVQEGRAGALEIYNYLYDIDESPTMEFSRILLFDSKKRIQLLEQYIQKNKDFAPAYYELSKEYSKSRLGIQTLSDQKKELQFIELFLELHNQGYFLRYFIDKELAGSWISDAKERLKVLKKLSSKLDGSRVTYTSQVSNRNFTLILGFKEDIKEILYKTSKESEYKSTGLDNWIDPKTGERAIRKWIDLPLKTTDEIISIKYLDINGIMQGPFEITFNAKDTYVENAKDILNMTRSSWVLFSETPLSYYEYGEIEDFIEKDSDGNEIINLPISSSPLPISSLETIKEELKQNPYLKFTYLRKTITKKYTSLHTSHLQSHTCGISEITIGYDNNIPDKIIKLTECNPKNPFGVAGKPREEYQNMSDNQFALCRGDATKSYTDQPCQIDSGGNLEYILSMPDDIKYVTIKIKFKDGEEMIEKFLKEDNCDFTCQ